MARPALFNIEIDYGRVFEETWTWLDRFGNAIDLSAYAAEHVIIDEPGQDPIIYGRVTNGSGITLGADGTIVIAYGGADTRIEGVKDAYHALIVYDSGTIDDDGEQIIVGNVRINESTS